MAPESCQEAEEAEKEAPLSPVDLEPVSGHLEPPAGTSQQPAAPAPAQEDAKSRSMRPVFSVNLQVAPDSLDTRTLRLLWGQRELEIQALRWAVKNHRDARYCHVLREVAGLPPERRARNQEKFLKNQVQKLTLDLQEQKEQAQLEKSQLEERLLQATTMMQKLEAELQAFQKSCLLQLARSSWVGRVLRSSTGSVEVVTAETLMDFSDVSESEQGPSPGEVREGFRLEDVDWNSIAHRYPNLFANKESSSDPKHARPLPPPQAPLSGERGPELRRQRTERRLKSVEWSSPPFVGTSSSGVTDSDLSNGLLSEPYCVQKMTGELPCRPGLDERLEASSGSLSREMHTQPEALNSVFPNSSVFTTEASPVSALGVRVVLEASRVQPSCSGSEPRSCASPECTCGVPQVGLASREMSTVRASYGAPLPTGLSLDLRRAQRDQPGRTVLVGEPRAAPEHSHSGRRWSPGGSCLKIVAVSGRERFVRVLNQSLEETVDVGGLVLQQLERGFPVCMYRFPPGTLLAPCHHVTVWGEGPRSTKRRLPSSLGQEPVHFHSSRGCVTLLLNPKGEVLSEHQASHCVSSVSRIFADNTDLSIDRFPLSEAGPTADTCPQRPRPQQPRAGRVREAPARRRRPRTRGLFPRLSASKTVHPRAVPVPSEAETLAPELLPTIAEAGLCLEDCQARKEPRVRVCHKIVDRSCPMVALSVQSTAESRYGFRFLPCPPVTTDPRVRV